MMDDAELVRRAREVLDGVTPGPWVVLDYLDPEYEIEIVSNAGTRSVPVADIMIDEFRTFAPYLAECKANARFITASRDIIPEMADRIEALIAERDAAREAALEEAAKVAESPDLPVFKRGWSTSQDAAAISTMMSISAAIRALKGKSHE